MYVSLPWLENGLNRFYLPVALICSTVFSLTAHYLFLTTHSEKSVEENAWQFFLFVCVPLVLVSWQYGFKSIVAYCLFMTFLDTLLVSQTRPDFRLDDSYRSAAVDIPSWKIRGPV